MYSTIVFWDTIVYNIFGIKLIYNFLYIYMSLLSIIRGYNNYLKKTSLIPFKVRVKPFTKRESTAFYEMSRDLIKGIKI